MQRIRKNHFEDNTVKTEKTEDDPIESRFDILDL